MIRIITKFGTLFLDGKVLKSEDKKTIVIYVDNFNPLPELQELSTIQTWHDFINQFSEMLGLPIMYALTLQELKNEFYSWQVETYNFEARKKRQTNKIVSNKYLKLGEHFMLIGYDDL